MSCTEYRFLDVHFVENGMDITISFQMERDEKGYHMVEYVSKIPVELLR